MYPLPLLKSYSCLTPRIPETPEEQDTLRQAIAWLIEQSEGENLGICAPDGATAETALKQYLQALGYPAATNITPDFPDGPVYLKCQTQTLRYYVESYDGDYRGVLIACQSDDSAIAGTYGYFPLTLFAHLT